MKSKNVKTYKSQKNSGQVMLRNVVVIGIILYYLIFMFIPIVNAFIGSFHSWNPFKGVYKFIGFENYKDILGSDLFWLSMKNNLIFTVVVVTFRVILGLAIALAIYSITKFKGFFRTIYFIPVISPLVAVAFVWKWMYNPQIGLINSFTKMIGMDPVNWLLNPNTALGSVIVMTIWKDVGYAVVIFLAGLLSLPRDIYEAASIDGANKRKVFWKITLPLLKPTTLFIVVTSLISYLQTFVQIFVMTEGGPGTKTYLTTYLIYEEAFVKYNFGYASAISFLLFIIIIILTVIQFKMLGVKGGE